VPRRPEAGLLAPVLTSSEDWGKQTHHRKKNVSDFQVDVFDTETASLEGGVCDIAIVRLDEDFNVLWEVESLIDPQRPISPTASGIHHITDDMVQHEPTLSEFMELHGFPWNRRGLIVGGHNVRFDIRVCKEHLPDDVGHIDTLKLARNFWPDAENHQLQTLRYMHKIRGGDAAHRAMGDVVTCINLLHYMADLKRTNLRGLMELSRAPLTLDTKFPFGKHKGVKLRDMPRSYCQWLLDNVHDLDPDLREAVASRV
jgi:exodeoxyribonuclease X